MRIIIISIIVAAASLIIISGYGDAGRVMPITTVIVVFRRPSFASKANVVGRDGQPAQGVAAGTETGVP